MCEVRFAKKNEIERVKEIWKLCFADSDRDIYAYFTCRYKADETVVLLQEGVIVAMLTLISANMVTADKRSFPCAMFYAIATHSLYRNRGFSSRIMEFSNQYLQSKGCDISVLVPAEKQLYSFYYKQGYKDGFYIREVSLLRDRIDGLPSQSTLNLTFLSAVPEDYNRLRNKLLEGRLFIAYDDADIAYQKKLSRLSGTDIYVISCERVLGCAILERATPKRVFIKELLLPDALVNAAVKQIKQSVVAEEYILRTPAYASEHLGGSVRPFGIYKAGNAQRISSEELGYMGLALD